MTPKQRTVPRIIMLCLTTLITGCGPSDESSSGATASSSSGSGGSGGSSGGESCAAGPANLSGLTVSFRRSEKEEEVYRFTDKGFTRDLAPGETSKNSGAWSWSGEPDCELKLDHATAPPNWPDAFTSEYRIAWTSKTAGIFTVKRVFSDGFTFSDKGEVNVVP